MKSFSPLRRTLLLWAVYLALALVLTWPTIATVRSHLPGDGGDDPAIAWNLWWVSHAVLNQAQNPFQSDFMFYPLGINLAFYTLTVLNALTALPLLLNFGVVTASNLHMFFTFVVAAYGTFLLVRSVLADEFLDHDSDRSPSAASGLDHLIWLSAAVAGVVYAYASSRLFYVALGQFNIASNHWVPFAALYIIRSRRRPQRLKNPFMAGLFLTFQTWSEMTYASFMLVFIALYWLYWLLEATIHIVKQQELTRGTRAKWALAGFRPHLRAAVIMGLTFAVGITPILLQMLPDMQLEGDFLVEGSGFAEAFSADLLGFIVPTMHHPLFGSLVGLTNIAGFTVGQHIYIGFVLLGLAIVTAISGFRRPEIRFWLLAVAVFALLCLGPVILINGQNSQIPGPFTLLQQLPFFKANRYPSRYSVMLMLSLSVVAAFALVQIGQWTQRRFKSHHVILRYAPHILIAALFLFEHAALPLPRSDMRLPAAYGLIAADPQDSTVLDIPFAWRNGFRITGALTTQFMFGQFYQTTHQKRLLQGNTSRNPEFKFQYFTDAPVISSLLALETGKALPPEQWAADQEIAEDVLRFFNIKYVVVRSNPDQENAVVTPQATIPYIENVFPVQKIHDDARMKIYQVRTDPDSRTEIEISPDSPLARLYFGAGWGLIGPATPMVAQRYTARLMVPLSSTRRLLTLRLRLPETAPVERSSVWVEVNGWQSTPQPFGPAWQEISFAIPAAALEPGLNNVYLNFESLTTTPPYESGTRLDDITVLSAGQEVGDFGHIFLNGHDVSINERGYNVTIVQPDQPLRRASFDTHLDPAASAELAGFLSPPPSGWPPGTVIAAAAADEASAKLGQEAVAALQSLGAQQDLRDCFRCSHAMISKITESGPQTTEAADFFYPVGISSALGLTEPGIAAEFDWITLSTIN